MILLTLIIPSFDSSFQDTCRKAPRKRHIYPAFILNTCWKFAL